MTHNKRIVARFIRRAEYKMGWANPGFYKTEQMIFDIWHNTLRWASLEINVCLHILWRVIKREFK